ncbi:signal peptidase I [Streptomyces sp. WMMC897]|uniref:signal peptidase I n=1 Tax=Streptomyces sp. WMMC897 TaxID=3014782 RepID=UPI0022B5FBF5|nr:signal peptidase I [Streptomyces sp. WMMC897]MCZ7417707.1 signal peptidase I [Streptomyces sp. WMMC897]
MSPRRVLAVALAVSALLSGGTAVGVTAMSVRVDGASMEPTLREGQRLLGTPGSADDVRRLDVALFHRPGTEVLVVKRVIGLPGDRVGIVSTPQDPYQVLLRKAGEDTVYRVTAPAWTQRARHTGNCCAADGTRSARPRMRTVPPGRFFFLGDNPDASDDSRDHGWGRLDDVTGRVGVRIWPPSAPRDLGDRPILTPTSGPVPGNVRPHPTSGGRHRTAATHPHPRDNARNTRLENPCETTEPTRPAPRARGSGRRRPPSPGA